MLRDGQGNNNASYHNGINSADISMMSSWDEPGSTGSESLHYTDNDLALSVSSFDFLLRSPQETTAQLKDIDDREHCTDPHLGPTSRHDLVAPTGRLQELDELSGNNLDGWIGRLFSLSLRLRKHHELISVSVKRIELSIRQPPLKESEFNDDASHPKGNNNERDSNDDCTLYRKMNNDDMNGGAARDSCSIGRTVELAIQLLYLTSEISQSASQPFENGIHGQKKDDKDEDGGFGSKRRRSGTVLQDTSNSLLLLSSYTLVLELFCAALRFFQRLAASEEISLGSLEDRLSFMRPLLPAMEIGNVPMAVPTQVQLLLVANSIETLANELHRKMRSLLPGCGYAKAGAEHNGNGAFTCIEESLGRDSGVARDADAEWSTILEGVYSTMTEAIADLRAALQY
ncbi:hypothetical protein QQS21_000281 [Conoideocrella luteorostrata]|uniref:Uncharacterized protein n=1 Tax=Conoideocrella luteorostrata TaxID=1105319 RepID=A0AAJ0CZE1_9HYPO|nr:hypothetical protein QQS21_000281 [Conoideocrella luteorostrata]